MSQPRGRYISSKWISVLTITSPSISVSLSIPRVVVGLTPSFNIMGFVKGEYDYKVIVRIDNMRVYEGKYSSNKFSIVVNPPFSISSLIVWFRNVDIEIIPLRTGYSPARFSYSVLFINPLFIMLLIVFTGLVYMHPVVSSTITGVFHGIRNLSTRRKPGREHEFLFIMSARKRYVQLKPRVFKTKRYYRSVLALLSKIVGYPRDSETLREYLSRIKNALPERAYQVLYQLFIMFEQDLYSARTVSVETVRHLYKSLLKMVRR